MRDTSMDYERCVYVFKSFRRCVRTGCRIVTRAEVLPGGKVKRLDVELSSPDLFMLEVVEDGR